MAETLQRPQVRIRQVQETTSPTVVTSEQPTCIIGPCYQVVEPIDSEGQLDTSSEIQTAAILRSSATLGETLLLSGLVMEVTLSSGSPQIVQFPVTRNGAGLSREQAILTMRKALTGITVELIDDILVLRSDATGDTASILLSTIADSAYAVLGLDHYVDTAVYGKTFYDNLETEVPYSSFPSPKADVEDVVITADEAAFYRYTNGSLVTINKDRAVNANAYIGGASNSGGTATTRQHQPAFGNRASALYGVPGVGTKTATLASLGNEAFVVIPLAQHRAGATGGIWPDPSLSNYLKVTASGLNRWAAGYDVGNYPGASGNGIKVIFDLDAAAGSDVAVQWVGGATKSLTITYKTENVTFAELQTALEQASGLTDDDLIVELVYRTADAAKQFIGTPDATAWSGIWVSGDRTYLLSEGVNPADFSIDEVGGEHAAVTGGMNLAGKTAAALGISGGLLELSIDGGPWTEIPLPGAANVDVEVNAALTAAGLDAAASLVSVNGPDGAGGSYLRIVSTSSVYTYGDSSIGIRGDQAVIEKIFSGSFVDDEQVTGLTPTGGQNEQIVLTVGTDFNNNAIADLERAFVLGNTTVEFEDVIIPPHMVLDLTDADILAESATLTLAYTVSAVAKTSSIDFSLLSTVADLVSALNVAFTAASVTLRSAEHNSRALIVPTTNTDTFAFDTTNGAGSTSAALITLLGARYFDVTLSPADSTLTVTDGGTDGAVIATKVGNDFANAILYTGFSAASSTELTSHILESSAGSDFAPSKMTATTVLASDAGSVGAALAVRFANPTTLTISYRRGWPCAAGPTKHSYTDRLWVGGRNPTLRSDYLYNNGSVQGRIVSVTDLGVGGSTYSGAKLTISEFSVRNGTLLNYWYLYADGLDSASNTRLSPEVVFSDLAQRAVIKAGVLHDTAGIPMMGSARIFVEYRALRLDVTGAASTKEILLFNDVDEVEALIGPVATNNPLALALSFAFLNSTSTAIAALGISDVSEDAPYGTVEAYAEALDVLEVKDVYSLVPLSQDDEVHQLFSTHVTNMSDEDRNRWRIAICSGRMVTEETPISALSGEMSIQAIGNGKYELTFDDSSLNIISALQGIQDANGDALPTGIGQTYLPENGVFLDRAGDPFRWLIVETPSASSVVIDTSEDIYQPESGPGSAGNEDAYYRTGDSDLADFAATGEACTIAVRQAAISASTSAGRNTQMEVLATRSKAYLNRRLFIVYPEWVVAPIAGTDQTIPGFYLAAAIGGMRGEQSPSQGFTNLPIVGFSAVRGSSDVYREEEMAIAAAGGIYWVVQDAIGSPLVSRHQLSTDTSSVETREMNITCQIDALSKRFKDRIAARVGRNNITRQFMDSLMMELLSLAQQASNDIIQNAEVVALRQSKLRPDGLEADVRATPYYSFNDLLITIYS